MVNQNKNVHILEYLLSASHLHLLHVVTSRTQGFQQTNQPNVTVSESHFWRSASNTPPTA